MLCVGIFCMEGTETMVKKPKKKLLVTASTFPRWEGDTEPRFVLDLASHMTNEFDVTVLVPAAPGAKEKEILDGIKVIRYHYFPVHKWETLCYPGAIVPRIREKKIRALLVPFLFLSLYFHLWKISSDYDIVHAHWLIPQGIVQSFFKTPYIVTGHGGDVVSLNKGIIRRLKIRCLKRAEHVTVVSEYSRKKLQELLPVIQPSIISMGVNTKQFGKQYREQDYFHQGKRKVVLFVGRLVEIKGVAYLIEAIKKIDALLVIAGDGPLRKELERQAADIKNRVLFLGAKPHDELKTIYASSDIFVVPSITIDNGVQEGVPTVIMEAMASGLAVVASDSGGISALVHDGQNGLLCEERNSPKLAKNIKKLIEDEKFYNEITDKAQTFIRQYDYKVLAQKFMEVYKDVLSEE